MHGPKHFSMCIRFWITYGLIVIVIMACSVFSFINSVMAGCWLTATVSFYPSVHENDCNEFDTVSCTDYKWSKRKQVSDQYLVLADTLSWRGIKSDQWSPIFYISPARMVRLTPGFKVFAQNNLHQSRLNLSQLHLKQQQQQQQISKNCAKLSVSQRTTDLIWLVIRITITVLFIWFKKNNKKS